LTDHNFQTQVIDSLARLETKMDALVGKDGSGGSQGRLDVRVADLERDKWKRSGAIGVVGALFGGACEFIGHYVFSGFHR